MRAFNTVRNPILVNRYRTIVNGIVISILVIGLAAASLVKTPRVKASAPASFGPASTVPGTGPGTGRLESIAEGDFNGDGKLDLVAANSNTNSISVALGDGSGGFGTATSFPVAGAGRPVSVAVGDFNRDGKLDVVTANLDTGNVSVLFGDGTGSFGAATDYAVGGVAVSVAVGDLRNSGELDIVVATQTPTSGVAVLVNDGLGGFTLLDTFAVGSGPVAITVGDFNNDGGLDVATANSGGGTVSILIRNPIGVVPFFAPAVDFSTGGINPSSLVPGDFNRDGKLDLAVTNIASANVAVLQGDGAGNFGPPNTFSVGDQPSAVTVGDFNRDGNLDLAVANNNAFSASVLLGDGVGGFGTASNFGVLNFPSSLVVGDFNRDGKPDLAAANFNGDMSVLLNTTTLSPSGALAVKNTVTTDSSIETIATGDFNRDGKLDMAYITDADDSVFIALGNGDGSFGAPQPFATGSFPIMVAVGDFNNDGKLDLAVTNSNDGTVSVLLGNGDGTFQPKTDYTAGDSPVVLTTGDFNRDGKLDLAVVDDFDDTISIFLGNGDGTFQTPVPYDTGASPESIVAGDFNRDGVLDLATANSGDESVSILIGNPDGTFQAKNDIGLGASNGPFTITSGDFDGNGTLDLATANPNNDVVSVLLGVGDGTFQAPQTYATGVAPTWVVAGDFNSDGKVDLVVANDNDPNSTVSLLTGVGDGTFNPKTDFVAGFAPFTEVVGDFNRDGLPDLAVGDFVFGQISILINGAPAPDLAITKFHTGSFAQGDTGKEYDISVTNIGQLPTDGTTVTVTDNLPAGLTATAIAGTGWTNCTATPVVGPGTLTCTRTDVLAPFDSYPILAVTVDVAGNASNLTNNATVAGGGDTNSFNNSSDDFTIVSATTVYTDPAGICGGNTPCYTSIQEAIESVLPGGTVEVGTGQYAGPGPGGFEPVIIDQPVTVNLHGHITVSEWFTENNSAVVNGLSANLSITDEYEQDAGTFNAGTGEVSFIGPGSGGPQVICGLVETVFNNLTIDNGSVGAVLDSNKFVAGVLTLSSNLDTASFTITITSTGSIVRNNNAFITGTVTKQVLTGTFSFPVGDTNGAMPLDIANATGGGDLTVKTTAGNQPDVDPGTSLGDYWTLTSNGTLTLDMTFHYIAADVNGNEANYRLIRVENNTPVSFGGVDTGTHTATLTNVSSFSDWTVGESVTPTAVTFDSFSATADSGGMSLQWKTGYEVNNLGFNIYRQVGGERVKINPSLIAGSALMVGSGIKVQAGSGYSWQDDVVDGNASYWLEDVDLNGSSTWHGPFGVTTSASNARRMSRTKSVLLNNINAARAGNQPDNATLQREYPADFAPDSDSTAPAAVTKGRAPIKPTAIASTMQKQWSIAAQAAIKISINQSGWYHLNMTDLMAAGLSTTSNPQTLQMFVGGTEIPIKVNVKNPAVLSIDDSIEFYGAAIDTPTSNTQMYWLVSGSQIGKRIGVQQSAATTSTNNQASFPYTVERKDRSLYFSSLLNGDAENWFGQVVGSQPATEVMTVHDHDATASGQAQLEIALQGVTTNLHEVMVNLNGQPIGTITYNGQAHSVTKLSIADSSIEEGDNNITITALGSSDVSLVDYVRITYAHNYSAVNNNLFTSVPAMTPVNVGGFTSNQIRAINVTNPKQPIEVEGTISGNTGNYTIGFGPAKSRDLLLFTPDQMLQPLSISGNQPSSLNRGAVANFVIITSKDFTGSLQPFVALKQSQGYKVAVVDVENIYDEFSYGVHTPQAVKDFLYWTYLHWPAQPQYVMLAGSGSLDPKNYTGLGNLDFVPTKLIDTASMETASDEWLVDFNNDGIAQMSIGRLPVRTADEMTTVVNKIIAYEQSGVAQGALMVADLDDGLDFSSANNQVKAAIPAGFNVVNIVRGQTSTDAKTELMDQLAQGGKIVNYAGHGSVNIWRGNLLTDDDVPKLANQKVSPLVVTMTCLNGYFQDPRLASLGESLIRVNQGGAVAVWSSSAMTDNGAQTIVDRELFRQIFSNTNITLGRAIREAKKVTQNEDVRRTWILFGDPTMTVRTR